MMETVLMITFFQHAEIEKTYYPEIMINLIAQVLEHQVLHSQGTTLLRERDRNGSKKNSFS